VTGAGSPGAIASASACVTSATAAVATANAGAVETERSEIASVKQNSANRDEAPLNEAAQQPHQLVAAALGVGERGEARWR